MTRTLRAFCCVLLFSLGWARAAWAQGPWVTSLVQTANDAIANIQSLIPTWTHAATWNLAFAITVGLLGVTAATLQLLVPALDHEEEAATAPVAPRGWKNLSKLQWAVVVVGAVISGLTLVMNLAFAADHREYKKSITKAKQVIAKLKENAVSFQQNPDVKAYDRLDALGEHLTTDQRKELQEEYKIVATLDADLLKAPAKELGEIEEKLSASALPLGEIVAYAAMQPGPTVDAAAESNNAWQAEQNASAAAADKMAALLVQTASLKLGDRERDNLRKYINEYAKKQSSQENAVAGRVRVRTQLSLPVSYANPASINAFLRANAQGTSVTHEQEIEKIRNDVKNNVPNASVDGFLEATATVPLNGGPVRLQAKNPKDGDFEFQFGVQPSVRQSGPQNASGQVQVMLQAMKVFQDASAGSTRWTFYVLSQGRVILSLPDQRWDDSKHPTLCWWEPDGRLTGQAAVVSGGVPLTIVGLKPKVTLAE